MGGSKSYSITKIVHKKVPEGPSSVSSVVSAVERGVTDQIALQALGAVISYEPTINTLLLAIKLLKIAYEMYVAAEEEYERTGDQDRAIVAAVEKGADIAIDKLKKEAIRMAVSKSLEQIKETQHIKSSPEIDTLVVDGVSSKLEELIQ